MIRYFVALYIVLLMVQIYFAGEGIFGARDADDPIEDAKQLNLHRDFGFIIGQPLALLLLIVALLAWLPDKRLRIASIVAPILLIVQTILAAGSRWVGALHPVNAVILVGLFVYLASRLWRGERALAAEPI